MSSVIRAVDWIDSQAHRMIDLVERWANINSASHNINGLERMAVALADAFSPLGGQLKLIDLVPHQIIDSSGHVVQKPLGRALSVIKRLISRFKPRNDWGPARFAAPAWPMPKVGSL